MSRDELVIGKAYVLRGLKLDPRRVNSAPISVRIGMLSCIHGGGYVVRLHRPGPFRASARRWARLGRVVELANFDREATEREISVGLPLETLEAVRLRRAS